MVGCMSTSVLCNASVLCMMALKDATSVTTLLADYMYDIRFALDGAMTCRIYQAGYMQAAYWDPGTPPPPLCCVYLHASASLLNTPAAVYRLGLQTMTHQSCGYVLR